MYMYSVVFPDNGLLTNIIWSKSEEKIWSGSIGALEFKFTDEQVLGMPPSRRQGVSTAAQIINLPSKGKLVGLRLYAKLDINREDHRHTVIGIANIALKARFLNGTESEWLSTGDVDGMKVFEITSPPGKVFVCISHAEFAFDLCGR